MRVVSVNVGRAKPIEGGKGMPSGIDKQPVEAIEVHAPGTRKGDSGVAGDHIGDRRHHGGDRQAVYAFSRDELDWWQAELGYTLSDGTFGENLTTTGRDIDVALVGERWQVGSALLEVCGPRIPCRTFAAHMGERGWVKRFAQRGRTGVYLAVLEPGRITPGDAVDVVHHPDHDLDVMTFFRALMGDRDAARRAVDSHALPPDAIAELPKL